MTKQAAAQSNEITTRIYLVTEPNGDEHFVRATSKARAKAFIVDPGYTVVVATADDIAGRRQLAIEVADEE